MLPWIMEQISKPSSIALVDRRLNEELKDWTLTHFEESKAVRSHGIMPSLGEGRSFNDKSVWARNQKVNCDNYIHFINPGWSIPYFQPVNVLSIYQSLSQLPPALKVFPGPIGEIVLTIFHTVSSPGPQFALCYSSFCIVDSLVFLLPEFLPCNNGSPWGNFQRKVHANWLIYSGWER